VDDVKLTVGGSKRAIVGLDTTILVLPDEAWVDVAGTRALAIQPLGRFLLRLAEHQAADLGEALHHADFVVTRSSATVESRGAVHDCDECRAAVRAALRLLREEPERDLVVGTLYWAAPV
jgi:hypothetical protein